MPGHRFSPYFLSCFFFFFEVFHVFFSLIHTLITLLLRLFPELELLLVFIFFLVYKHSALCTLISRDRHVHLCLYQLFRVLHLQTQKTMAFSSLAQFIFIPFKCNLLVGSFSQ